MYTCALIFCALVFFSGALLKEKKYGATVVSFNIRYDNPDDGENGWKYRKDSLAEFVISEKPDIIGLQEVLYGQYVFLKNKWPQYKSYGVGREDGKLKGEMCPIFFDSSKYTLLSAETKWLSETIDIPSKGYDAACERIVTVVWLYHKNLQDSLLVLNSHWDHMGKVARQKSAEYILKLIQPALDAGQHVVLTGDFNAKPSEPPILLLKEKLIDSCPEDQINEGTYNGWSYLPMYSPRIDYIFYSKAFTKSSYYFIHKRNINGGRELSDHYMIDTYLRFN